MSFIGTGYLNTGTVRTIKKKVGLLLWIKLSSSGLRCIYNISVGIITA